MRIFILLFYFPLFSYASQYHIDEEAISDLLPKTIQISDVLTGKCPASVDQCTVSRISEQDMQVIRDAGDPDALQYSKLDDPKRAIVCLQYHGIVWMQAYVPGIEVNGEKFAGRLYSHLANWISVTTPAFYNMFKSCGEAMLYAKAGKIR